MRRVHFDIHESPVAHSARNGLKTYVCEMTCARARQVAGVNEAIRKVFGDFRNGR